MFSQVSVCPQGEYLDRYPLPPPRQVHSPRQVNPRAGTLPQAGKPPGRYTPRQVPPGQVHPPDRYTPSQHAGGTHPTGMHSCININIEKLRWESKYWVGEKIEFWTRKYFIFTVRNEVAER